MAGGLVKYRHLSRHSAHRQALLRNLVTSLFEHESIHTTWHKAKEAQRIAEKLVTLAKRNTNAARIRAGQIFFRPDELVPKLFSTIRKRYVQRPGGYTRVLRTEPQKEDQAASAILELVDGPRDMRFAITAQTIARDVTIGRKLSALTEHNRRKVVRYRPNGEREMNQLVERFRGMDVTVEPPKALPKKKVYRPRIPNHYYPRERQKLVEKFR